MDMLFFAGEVICLAALVYGGWLCFVNAGRYDAESLRADEAASRRAQLRAHQEAGYPPLDLAASAPADQ